MKKLYTLLIAASVCASASAADECLAIRSHSQQRTDKSTELPAFPAQIKTTPVNKLVRGLRKADSNTSLEGYWTIILGDYYFDTSTGDVITTRFFATMEDDVVTFTPGEGQDDFSLWAFKGKYDAENFTLTFGKELIDQVTIRDPETQNRVDCWVYQVPFIWNEASQKQIYVESITATYVPENNQIEFELLTGIDWPGYLIEDPGEYTEPAGYFATYDLVMGYQFTTTPYLEGEWEPIGNATFTDGWLVPAMGLNQQLNQYDLLLEQSVENKYVYRLVNPYGSGPVAKYNGNPNGYIVFDISDPDHVLFLPSDAGFENYAILPGGIYHFYCYNQLGYLVTSNPDYTLEELIDLVGDNIPYTTFANGKVALGSKKVYEQLVYDANFGTQNKPVGGASWEGANMRSAIDFPSWYDAEVGAIAADDEGEAVYYNMQGLRVDNPEPGQMLIKRTASKGVKVVIR